MESKLITGEVQAIRKDRKGIEVLGNWYSSVFKVIEDVEKGDTVKIRFTENKGFRNIKDFEILPDNKEVIAVLKQITELTPTDKNCILMTAKDIYLSIDNTRSLEECIKFVKELRLNI